ncbi:UDP-glycosyltransferase UGT4 isoform X2 [Stomoxys calcitrans]|uniref:UDP-glycosyltransferase UGT4 isoform X2 n=1 Tax=Stomoxys calcitrans TaxID=35570 RepID=UPI0027E3586B|nr:UDP-glycosyltransferase UGT4 isoform X2 [Stomoxys calcitrans]
MNIQGQTFVGWVLNALIGFSILQGLEAKRILSVFPSPSVSHLLIHMAVADTLANDGHDVTVIATIPNRFTKSKVKYLHIEGPMFDHGFANHMINNPSHVYVKFAHTVDQVLDMANATMNNRKMLQFLHDNKAGDFDLVILGYFMNDFMLGLGAHFQCPIVLSFMVQPIFPTNKVIGNPAEASYVSSLFAGFKQPMDFWQRVINYLSIALEYYVLSPVMDSKVRDMYRYNFPPDRYPPLEEVYKNVSLVLTNHHFSQGPIRPNVPALIEIGGIQIKEQPDPLPEDLAKIMDSAKHGIIYFSLGTNVQGSNLSKEKAKLIFNVLSSLPQTVLMKWGDKDFPGEAANIIYKSWLPQDDILAHPNVKLFITHGGQGSVVESQYHGVPMVGIPFFGDQHSNMANVEKSGFGIGLKYATLNENELRASVLEVLNNPKYRENVQRFSKLYRDRPMSPRQLVSYWVDYVIRHKGAKHMQSPAVHMSWWELHSLDVIGFLVAVLTGVVWLLVFLVKLLCCRGRKASASKAVKNQKKKKA